MLYRGRIAPSPTGYLHLGHARTFLIAAERARQHGGRLILRNDDLDTQRARASLVQAMIEDLAWLGLTWHEGPQPDGTEMGDAGPYSQSKRSAHYADAFEHLRAMGAIYPCVCSRRDVQAAIHAPHAEDDDEPLYPGTCRVGLAEEGRSTAWRFRVPEGEIVCFEDQLLGPQAFVAGRDLGDFIVMRRDGVPSYQLACAVDDAAMAITEVVRGRDLLRSTARQLLLLRALSLPRPAYAHCPLVLDEHGTRLAKSDHARSLRHFRENGMSAAAVRALALGEAKGSGVAVS